MFDFVVIGAGIAGASVADALAPTASVALLEAEQQPGYHSTGRSAALFAPNYGSSMFRALARASASFLRSPPPSFTTQELLRARGALHIGRPDQREHLARVAGELEASGTRIEVLSIEAACALVPLLRPAYLGAAAFEPDVQDIDVDTLFRGFLNRGRHNGVRLLTGARIEAPQWRQNAWHFLVNDEAICGRVLINAAGAWADVVGVACGARAIGLQALRRSVALIDPPAGVSVRAWPAVFDVDEQFYLKPDTDRLLVSPADEEPVQPCDAYAEDLAIAIAVDRMQSALDIEVARVARNWAGLRTFAPDRDPGIGLDPKVRNLFWCAGQGGYGIQTAFAFSRLAAALAREESVPTAIAEQGLTASSVWPARFS